jgi:hypothetical protein
MKKAPVKKNSSNTYCQYFVTHGSAMYQLLLGSTQALLAVAHLEEKKEEH